MTKPVVPPMPEVERSEAEGNLVLQMYCTALENWGLEGWQTAQREAALADELAEALEELQALVRGECPSLLDGDRGGLSRLDLAIDSALSEHKEARNG